MHSSFILIYFIFISISIFLNVAYFLCLINFFQILGQLVFLLSLFSSYISYFFQ